jgi:crotonobetainyl-CoA:carnitine CoA-transferase CaiB-like acyl-CoA transferase
MDTQTAAQKPGALAGIRVLDLGRVLAAPLAGQMLADFGAEVIKIERPGSGDDGRSMNAVATIDRNGNRIASEGSMFVAANRAKRSVALDLSKPEGRDLFLAMADKADVVLENFTTGTMDRLGIGYDVLAARNPRLVFCSVTAYGTTGPYARYPGFDPLMQAFGGLISVTGLPDGVPGGGGAKVGSAVCDVVAGLNAAFGIMVALRHRDVSGRGQRLETSLLDASSILQVDLIQKYLINGQLPARAGRDHPLGAPAGAFAASDGEISILAGTEQHFAPFCRLIGRVDLATDPRFATYLERLRNQEVLKAELRPAIAKWTVDGLVLACNKAGIPASPINDYRRLFADPQVQHRALAVPLEHWATDDLRVLANPVTLSATPAQHHPFPRLGQHSDEVLGDLLGLDDAALERLRRDGVIGQKPA